MRFGGWEKEEKKWVVDSKISQRESGKACLLACLLAGRFSSTDKGQTQSLHALED